MNVPDRHSPIKVWGTDKMAVQNRLIINML